MLIYGTSVECRARVFRTRAEIDFDLYSCNYDLQSQAADRLWDEYNSYRAETGFKTKMHPHFSKTSIWFDVHRNDGEAWFQKVLRELQDPDIITLCDAAIEFRDFYAHEAEELLLGTLIELGPKTNEGDVVRMVSPVWLEIVRLIQVNPGIMDTMDPRQFEALIAGSYKRAGFEVTITPRSGDHGIDVIAERRGLGKVRIVEQVKRFKPGHQVTANDVRALGYVALADGKHTKGVVTTTSRFAPRIGRDRYLGKHLGSKIELVDGKTLLDRLVRIMHEYE
ncbi:restriction endonuclease [Allorhodopirellula solitaria]|uniref:restriction endonuclease n=1 Tax=Allorhodopirellula solitaria TaxID=2527987 RepID=UPI001646A07E|nr:restriction endonuclease [Allorhodopirellula solitaria]